MVPKIPNPPPRPDPELQPPMVIGGPRHDQIKEYLAEAKLALDRARLMLVASWVFFMAGLALFLRSL
jgi:hypothetical protein